MAIATPDWLRQRALGHSRTYPVSMSSARLLALEATLDGHLGCVNCLDWNLNGSLLLSGSDDRSVILWNPLKHLKQTQIRTGHLGNIFSVKFISNKSDTQIATCSSDAKVKVIDILGEKTILNCDSCHAARVKRLATHQNLPDLIWSAAEDGRVMQYDLRQSHRCMSKNALIDLSESFNKAAAKCVAINPLRDEMLAVGGSDGVVRVYDRRLLEQDTLVGREKSLEKKCPMYYSPGQITTGSHRSASIACGVTYVTFNPTGTELLANLRSEQIYLFDLFGSWAKPAQMNLPKLETKCQDLNINKENLLVERISGVADEFYREAIAKIDSNQAGISKKFTMNDLNETNRLLTQQEHSYQLHQLKAAALVDRNWRGDLYESMRESLRALELNPYDSKSWLNLSYTVNQHQHEEMAVKLLEILRYIHDRYGSSDKKDQSYIGCFKTAEVNFATNLLLQTMRIPSNPPSPIEELSNADGSYDILEEIIHSADLRNEEMGVNRLKRPWTPRKCVDEKSMEWNEHQNQVGDYSKRFCGHCNINTDIKEANFFGPNGEFILAGSDDGALYMWDKKTTNLVKAVQADTHIVNCVQVHPNISMIATSGIESNVKLWSPSGKINKDVQALELRCNQNQQFVSADPLDAMMMMFYPSHTSSN